MNDELGTQFFMDQQDQGNVGLALWENGYVDSSEVDSITGHGDPKNKFSRAAAPCSQGAGYTSGQTGQFTINKRLTMWLAKDTAANVGYVIQFHIQNPLKMQTSPAISIEARMGDASTLQGRHYLWDSSQAKGSTTVRPGQSLDFLPSPCTEQEAMVRMDKDTASVLCCTSCSFARGAVAAGSLASGRSDEATDGQMTTEGDAEPLKIHAPFFCTKTVGQSSPYPCANNSITVTITANTFLSANGTVITITGLYGAIAPSGVMEILDGPNLLGHHLHFAAEGAPADWTVQDNRTKGQGSWDNDVKKLTLYVAKNTDCANEYVFRFQVINAARQQGAPNIQIEAEWPGNSKQLFEASQEEALRINRDAMNHDVVTALDLPYAKPRDTAALRIWGLQFKSHAIAQSSPYPCANNSITVSFKTNIPLLNTPLCKPQLTLVGLANAIAASGPLALSDHTSHGSTVAMFERSNDWSNGTVVESTWYNTGPAQSTNFLVLEVWKSTSADEMYAFQFLVSNPAGAQDCPTTSIRGSGCGDICSDDQPSGGGCTASTGEGVPSVMTPAGGSSCAMHVEQLMFTSFLVEQSSPFKCDNNTIAINFVSSVPIFKDCSPRLTLSGFGSVVWPPAGQLGLLDVGATGAAGPGIGFGTTGAWSGPGAGTLTLTDSDTHFEKDRYYNLSFHVTNPSAHQEGQQISYKFAMSSTGSTNLDSMTVTGVLTAIDARAEPLIAGRSQANVGYENSDTHPLFIRKPTLLVANISQQTSNPCADNTLRVLLRSNVPLLTTSFPGCMPLVSLSGLQTSGTFADFVDIVNIKADGVSSADVVGTKGKWTQSLGVLVLNFTDTFQAGVTFSMDFVIINPAKGQASQPVSITLWDEDTVAMNRHPINPPLFVEAAEILLVHANQTSDVPCEDSQITVTVSLNVVLFARCSPTLTITGLRHSRSAGVSVTEASSIFGLTSWDQVSGSITLNTTVDVPAAQYAFTVTLRNPNFGQSSQLLSVEGHIFNLVPSSLTAPAAGTPLRPVPFTLSVQSQDAPLRVAQLALTSFIGQSNPYPCGDNEITGNTHAPTALYYACCVFV